MSLKYSLSAVRNVRKIGMLAVLAVLISCFTACGSDVLQEVYMGTEYYTTEEAKMYIETLLGTNIYLYENDSEYAMYSLQDNDMGVSYLDHSVSFSDGTEITLPCSYSDVKSKGWTSEESEKETFVSNNNIYCEKDNGWRLAFGRVSEDPSPAIKDSEIDNILISIGSKGEKENYSLITTRDPEFTYMGLNRDSTPTQVLNKLGLPNSIDHNDVRMTFEYTIKESSTGRWLRVQFTWLTLKDGPEIMDEFKLLYSESYKLLW